MKNKWFDRKDALILLLVFAAALIPRLLFSLQMIPFLLNNDELATISSFTLIYPAQWSEVLTNLTNYYGGGFTILFTPLFYWMDDPVEIYHTMLSIYCVVQALITVPAYCVIRKHFLTGQRWLAGFLSLAASYMVTRRSDNITNETALYLLTWIIFAILMELIDSIDQTKKKRILSLVLALLYAYALSIHERSLAFLGMFAVLFLFYLLVYRRCIVSIPFFGVPFAGGYILARLFKKAILAANYSAVLKNVANTSVGGNFSNLKLLTNSGNWKAFGFSMIGSFTTASLVTCALLVAGTFIFLKYLGRGLFRSRMMREAEDEGSIERKFLAGFVFFYCGIFAIIFMQAAGWLPSLEAALELGWGTTNYSLKIITYIRYYGICLGPVVVLTVLYLYKRQGKTRLLSILTILGSVFLSAFWLRFIYRYVMFSDSGREAWYPFGGDLTNNTFGHLFYIIGAVVLIAAAVLLFLVLRKKWFNALLLVLCGFFIFQYVSLSNLDLRKNNSNENLLNTYRACERLGLDEIMTDLYVNSTVATRYQFLFYDSQVHPELPDYDIDQGIVLTSSLSQFREAFDHGWKRVELQSEVPVHYLLMKGDALLSRLDEKGVSYSDQNLKESVLYPEDFIRLDAQTSSAVTDSLWFAAGTYELTVDGSAEVSILDGSGNVLCTNAPDDEEVSGGEAAEGSRSVFSTLSGKKLKAAVRLEQDVVDGETVTDEGMTEMLEEILTSIEIRQISDNYILGISDAATLAEAADAVNREKKFDKLYYCYDADSTKFDLSHLSSQVSGVSVEICDSVEAGQLTDCWLLVNTTDDWLSYCTHFDPVLINSRYVLLAAKERPDDGFVDIEKLQMTDGMPAYLHAGTYRLRFSGFDAGDEGKTLGYQVKSLSSGKILAKGLLGENGSKESSMHLSGRIENWAFMLLSNEEVIPCERIEISKPYSVSEAYYSREYGSLVSLIEATGYSGEICVFDASSDYDSDVIRKYIERDSGKASVVINSSDALDPYDPAGSGISSAADWILLPRTSENVYPLMPEYAAVQACSSTLAMVRNTPENIALLEKNGVEMLSRDGLLSTEFYDPVNSKLKSVSVPKGTYRLHISVEEDVKDQETLSVYRGTDNTVITTVKYDPGRKDTVVTVGSLEGFGRLIAGPGANAEGMVPASVTKAEKAKYKITGIERVSNDFLLNFGECALSEGVQYNAEENTLSGTGKIRLRSALFRVTRNHVYHVRAKIKGDPVSVGLYMVNTQFLNEIINARSVKNNITDLGDGITEVYMLVIPQENRKYNVLDFEAEFNGVFEVLEIRLEKEEQE